MQVLTTVWLDNGSKVRLYEDGTGWNASDGHMATAAELDEARKLRSERRGFTRWVASRPVGS